MLRSLCLNHNDLDAVAVHHLFMMRLPALSSLQLTHAVCWLAQASQMYLNLSCNQLDAADVAMIASTL